MRLDVPNNIMQTLLQFVLVGALGAFPLEAANSQSVADFYRSHPLALVIGYTPGATYDIYARALGRHISRHLPGSPNVISQNMPGAGSLKSVNYLYNTAPRDGSTIAIFNRGLPMLPLLNNQGIQFDALKLSWIGSPASETGTVFAWHATSFKSIEDAFSRQMTVAATGTGADTVIFPYMLNNILGTKFKVVTGYPGAAETLLAVERGEVDGSVGTSWSTLVGFKKEWLEKREINILLQLGTKARPDIEAPFVMNLAKNDSDRGVMELIFSRELMAYPFAAPPDLPPERIAALRAAFDATMQDPKFLADAKQQGLEVNPVTGVEISSLLKRVYSSPLDVLQRARRAVGGN